MTSQRADPPRPSLSTGRLALGAITLVAFFCSGCFAPALGIAPLALQAGEMVGVGAIEVAGHAARGESASDNTSDHDVDSEEGEERCDELELEVPGTIEFQVAHNSPIAWRELQLGGSTDAPQWQAVAGDQSDAAGWRPLTNLHRMSFEPPLQNALTGGKPNYLAYAPAEPRTSVERDQLVALTADFGAGQGTFRWNGRAYQYTLVNRLPCFPGPVVVAK
jgi:hypothetical protein